VESPKIYLAVDNCFASKRWTQPLEWLEIVKESGLNYVEASADNECDPLYTNSEYIKKWIKKIKKYSGKNGVKVVNLYSGHGTYSTIGLSHTDRTIREHMLNNWLKKMVDVSGMLGAGLGFFCHAFPDSVLQVPKVYRQAEEELYKNLAELAIYKNTDSGCLSVEQMYTPHQIPWTIDGAEKLLKKVKNISGKDFYITIDTGHQCGQQKFTRPNYEQIKEWLRIYQNGGRIRNLWLGPKSAYDLFYSAADLAATEDSVMHGIEQEMNKYPYLFANYTDSDTYIWLERLACYSPIIHLQQTTGNASLHQPFTTECNERGIIVGNKVLKSILNSYKQEVQAEMPTKCSNIYLTLEIFSGTADINEDILYNLKESVKYWRQFVPEDGLPLDKLVK
jgi:sugar phosphate isomerase/epimerase